MSEDSPPTPVPAEEPLLSALPPAAQEAYAQEVEKLREHTRAHEASVTAQWEAFREETQELLLRAQEESARAVAAAEAEATLAHQTARDERERHQAELAELTAVADREVLRAHREKELARAEVGKREAALRETLSQEYEALRQELVADFAQRLKRVEYLADLHVSEAQQEAASGLRAAQERERDHAALAGRMVEEKEAALAALAEERRLHREEYSALEARFAQAEADLDHTLARHEAERQELQAIEREFATYRQEASAALEDERDRARRLTSSIAEQRAKAQAKELELATLGAELVELRDKLETAEALSRSAHRDLVRVLRENERLVRQQESSQARLREAGLSQRISLPTAGAV